MNLQWSIVKTKSDLVLLFDIAMYNQTNYLSFLTATCYVKRAAILSSCLHKNHAGGDLLGSPDFNETWHK